MADTLTQLFGSTARVKLLRLFLFNPTQWFTVAEAAARTRAPKETVRREVGGMHTIALLNRAKRREGVSYMLNPEFSHLTALHDLILNTPMRGQDIYKQIESVGAIKLVVTSGIFMGEREVALDIFIVGDRINEQKLKSRLHELEAELGKELRYAALTSEEFFYRLNMSDRLIRDVFDYPHRIAYDRLDIGLK